MITLDHRGAVLEFGDRVMEQVDRIDLVMASGPGIASPTIDRYELVRAALDAEKSATMDALVRAADFFSLTDAKPMFEIMDGPHKSRLSVTLTTGRTHSIAFLAASAAPVVRSIVDFVVSDGRSVET